MTTRDKLEFVFLMAKNTSATLSDIKRLLHYANDIMATPERKLKLIQRAEAICNRFAATIVISDAVYVACTKARIKIPT